MTKPTHALLPIEPTEKMAAVSTWDMHQFYQARRVWADMLKMAPVVQADLCEECQGSFIGFTGPTKWCPYCGARHRGAETPIPPLDLGEEDQRRSDAAFNRKQLMERGARVLGLDPDNTSWFEIIGELERLVGRIKSKASNYSDVVSDGGLDPRNRTP